MMAYILKRMKKKEENKLKAIKNITKRIMRLFVAVLLISTFFSLSKGVFGDRNMVNAATAKNKTKSFKQYYYKTIKRNNGEFKKTQTGTMREVDDKWLKVCGVMGASVQDFDQDGKKEMLVIRAKKTDNKGEASKIMLEMYEKDKDEIRLSAELAFTPYYTGKAQDVSSCTKLTANHWGNVSFIANYVKQGEKSYIACEKKEVWGNFADGAETDYWILEYKNSKFEYVSSLTQTAGGSSDFDYTFYKINAGKLEKSELYYSDSAFSGKGKYSSFAKAVEKYFGQYKIKLNSGIKQDSWSWSNKSILKKNKQCKQLWSFCNECTKKESMKKNKFLFEYKATVKALNNFK